MTTYGPETAGERRTGGFAAGSRIAGYLLQEEVGSGGMAVVFRALDERLQRQVALKILTPALAKDPTFRLRFVRESLAAAAVDHPHIIPVHEAGEADNVLFIAMRYVPGPNVRTMLHQHGPLSVERAAAIISPIASALDAAHAAGLVHRDVKPANILVDARAGRPFQVYLSDFGLSKGALASARLTGPGQLYGTPNYMTPEQIEGRPADARSDQYSLACTAFELLTGQAPFQRDQGMAVIWAHLSQEPPLASYRRPGLEGADKVLARALAKDPAKRYPSCGEFAAALRDGLGLAPYQSGPSSVWPPSRADAAATPGRGPEDVRITASAAANMAPRHDSTVPQTRKFHPALPASVASPESAVSAASASSDSAASSAAMGTEQDWWADPERPGDDTGSGGHDESEPQRRRLWPLTTAMLIALALVIGGGMYIGYRYTQREYYVGTNHNQVVIYRGINQSVLGFRLSNVSQRTGIQLSSVPADMLPALRHPANPGSLALALREVTSIRRAIAQCNVASAALARWNAAPRSVKKTVRRHHKTITITVTLPVGPKPLVPAGCVTHTPLPGMSLLSGVLTRPGILNPGGKMY